MSILQRYVFKELLGPFGLGMLVFTFIFLIGQMFKLTDLLLNSGIPASLAGELILTLLPNIFSLTIPMAILLATLLGVGRLAADREILAIRTSGVNLFKVFVPVLVAAALVAGALAWVNQSLVPRLNLKFADLRTQIAFAALSALPPDQARVLDGTGGGPSSTFFFEARDPETHAMKGVRIHTRIEESDKLTGEAEDVTKDRIRELQNKKDPASRETLRLLREQLEQFSRNRKAEEALIVAARGSMSADMAQQMITIELSSGTLNTINSQDPASNEVVHFSTFTKNIFPQDGEGGLRRKPQAMTATELRKEIRDEPSAKKRNPMIAEFWRRLSIPLACLAFALIGIPLAVYARPTGKAVAFALSFFLILIYYGLLNWGLSLGKTGSDLAAFAIFLPNILLSAVGGFLLYRMVMR